MKNPRGTAVPNARFQTLDFVDIDGHTLSVVIASYRGRGGKFRAGIYWRRRDDRRLRSQLLTWLRIWAKDELQIDDLRMVEFYGFRIGTTARVEQFKMIGAHRERGDLFPIFFPPSALVRAIEPAIAHLTRIAFEKFPEATDVHG